MSKDKIKADVFRITDDDFYQDKNEPGMYRRNPYFFREDQMNDIENYAYSKMFIHQIYNGIVVEKCEDGTYLVSFAGTSDVYQIFLFDPDLKYDNTGEDEQFKIDMTYGYNHHEIRVRYMRPKSTHEKDLERFAKTVIEVISDACDQYKTRIEPQRNAKGFMRLSRNQRISRNGLYPGTRRYYPIGYDKAVKMSQTTRIVAVNIQDTDDFGMATIDSIGLYVGRTTVGYTYNNSVLSPHYARTGRNKHTDFNIRNMNIRKIADMVEFIEDHTKNTTTFNSVINMVKSLYDASWYDYDDDL